MFFALIITIGMTTYNYDHLRYGDLETCEYHKEKIYDNFMAKKWDGHGSMKVECKKVVD